MVCRSAALHRDGTGAEVRKDRQMDRCDKVTLERLVKYPGDYGIFYGTGSLQNVLQFVDDHPNVVDGVRELALTESQRCIGEATNKYSQRGTLEYRIAHQLQKVHSELAWTELDLLLEVESASWNKKRYMLLARELCCLAGMHEYWWERWPDAQGPSNRPAAEQICELSRMMFESWKSLQAYVERCGIRWKADIASKLNEDARIVEESVGCSEKSIYRDHGDGAWLIKYEVESILNPVLTSLFSRLSGCPGGDLCPVFLDYDRRAGQPCSVQRYLTATPIRYFDHYTKERYSTLIAGSRLRATQLVCQAVQEWLLGNTDGDQVIVDSGGNLIFIDQDRSFFYGGVSEVTASNVHVTSVTGNKGIAVEQHGEVRGIRTALLEATMEVPGVAEDLAAYLGRVETLPEAIYEGLIRNASYHANQLRSLFCIDITDSGAVASARALEAWIQQLLSRKRGIHQSIAQQVSIALRTPNLLAARTRN
jgi:hypothetical protein